MANADQQALIIGNDAYSRSPLPCCLNDADGMDGALRSIGFRTHCGRDLKNREMKLLVDRFVHSIQPGSVVIFYYSGHGLQLNGVNYLVPVDNSPMINPSEMSRQYVNVQKLLNDLYARQPKLVIVILDACRSDEALNGLKHLSAKAAIIVRPGLAAMRAPPGTIIAYACGADEVSYGRSKYGHNSVYTYHLLRYITTPNTDVDLILRKVATQVQKETRNEQTPFRYSSYNDIFYLVSQQKRSSSVPSRERHRREQQPQAYVRLPQNLTPFQLPATKFIVAPKRPTPDVYGHHYGGQMRLYR